MSQPETYRETGTRERIEFWGVLTGWWILMAAVLWSVPGILHGGIAFGIILALGALALAPLTFLSGWQRKLKAARLSAALARAGFDVRSSPSEQERRAVLHEVAALALLRNAPEDVGWIARRRIDGRDVTVLHHTYIDGSGRTWYDRKSTVVAITTDDPRPGVWLTRTNLVTARRDEDSGYGQDLIIGDAWFDENFRIQSHDPASLPRILTPAVRQLIAGGPWKESWTIGYGYVVCVFGADTTAQGILVMIRRVQSMIQLLEAGTS